MKTQYGWDWSETARVALLADDQEIASVGTRFPSRDGLRLVDLANKHQPARVQVSDHGCGRKSVQMFDDRANLLCDVGL